MKNIIFDLGQVLVQVLFHDFRIKFAEAFNTNVDILAEETVDGAHIDFMVGKISPDEFHRMTCERFHHFISLHDFKKLWLGMLGGKVEGTDEIVAGLRRKGHHLHLLSNVDQWHFEFCQNNFPVLKHFEKKFVSYQMKLKKPDQEIYELVVSELKASADECLFIDDKQENVVAAQTVGMDAIQFSDAFQLKTVLNRKGIIF
ncbi:MAG: HAD family phosphatase [bacterium]|nr:HAD family phosphatase [bacterium]